MEDLIIGVKKKKEFSKLPNSVVRRALEVSKGDIKEARGILRKYLGIFLTNKVVKGKGEEVLKSHISSKDRDYEKFYLEIFKNGEKFNSVIDFGCGVNGFSYKILEKYLGEFNYVGFEASGQIVENLNSYFEENNLDANSICLDLFDLEKLIFFIEKTKEPRVAFLFQVIDALESFEPNFSKKFIIEISKYFQKIVLSLPLGSIGGKTKFAVQRKWLISFLEENFKIEKDFKLGNERVLVIANY